MQQLAPVRLYAHGPMFRYERPQKGRYRQFHQIDAEIIGAAEPQADIELIAFAAQLLADLGIEGVALNLNTLGDPESRAAYRAALVDYFSRHAADLSRDSRTRLEKNPLRILDSKDSRDQEIAAGAPRIDAHLTPAAHRFLADVEAGLAALDIPYVRNPKLVRGLDYYTHTVFEFLSGDLGAQNAVLSGGRYDGLIEQLGGPATPGVGWAGGIERLAMLASAPDAPARPIAVIPLGDAAQTPALRLANDLRRAGLAVDQAYSGNMKKRLKKANAANAIAAVILGEDELAAGEATLRDLDAGVQSRVALGDVAATCARRYAS